MPNIKLHHLQRDRASNIRLMAALTILAKEKSKKKMKFVDSTWVSKEQRLVQINERKFHQSKLQSSDELLFAFQSDVLEIRCKTFLLGDRYNVNFGMQLRDRQLYPQDVISVEQRKLKTKFHKPCYTGKDVQKWHLDYSGLLAYFNREAQSGGCTWEQRVLIIDGEIDRIVYGLTDEEIGIIES